jgi:rhamnosyltransferase
MERNAMTTLGALVVLFHPTAEELARVVALRERCDGLTVVDNSPQRDLAVAVRLASHDITLVHNGNRNGIAGALNCGLASQFEQGMDAVALFDQDSVVPAGYFSAMRDACAMLGTGSFMAGPRIFDENDQRFLPELASDGLTVQRLKLHDGIAPQRCAFLISSGCLISRKAFETLGRFDEPLFIDHVDTEYCLRALARNVPLYVIPSLILSHRIGERRRHKLGPFHMTATHHPWYRRYYSARNAMQLGLQYGMRFPVAIVPNLLTLWQIVQVLLLEDDKLAKLNGILLGISDGLFGRLGPLEQTRPALAARFAHSTHRTQYE